jgi:hypothetical protein
MYDENEDALTSITLQLRSAAAGGPRHAHAREPDALPFGPGQWVGVVAVYRNLRQITDN